MPNPDKRYPMRLAKFRSGWMDMKPALPVPVIDWIHDKKLDIAYGGDKLQRFDIYYPNGKKDSYPLFIVIHGGGWGGMDKRDWHLYPSFYALERGFAVASINYRLAPKHGIMACIDDCYDALGYLITHADELRLDLRNVFLWGASAGGHLGTITALRYIFDPRISIKAMIPVTPAFDMKPMFDTMSEVLKDRKFRREFIFGLPRWFVLRWLKHRIFGYQVDFEQTPDLPCDASRYLDECLSAGPPDKTPRFYFQYGGADYMISTESVEDFAKKLQSYGFGPDDIVLDRIEDAPHMGASHHYFDDKVILRYVDFCEGLIAEGCDETV